MSSIFPFRLQRSFRRFNTLLIFGLSRKLVPNNSFNLTAGVGLVISEQLGPATANFGR
jgi:hypothetical protein